VCVCVCVCVCVHFYKHRQSVYIAQVMCHVIKTSCYHRKYWSKEICNNLIHIYYNL